MKTTSTSKKQNTSELNNRSHHQSDQAQPTAAAPAAQPEVTPHSALPTPRSDNRLPIDAEARKQNRTLPTPKVLSALHQQLPAAYRVAEVVGKWIWVTFKE